MIDGHCHLDRKFENCSKAMQQLYDAANSVGIKGVVLVNIPELNYDSNDVLEYAKNYNGFFKVFPSVKPGTPSIDNELRQLKDSGATGFKLHPRLHNFYIGSDESINIIQRIYDLKMPIIIDGFLDGKNLSLGNLPEAFAKLFNNIPFGRIAIGHAGGHRIIDTLMVAKYFKNIYLDLSYTLLYYRNSSIMIDIGYAIRNMRGERIFWGSDYPDRPYNETIDLSLQEFRKMNLSALIKKSVFEENVRKFLGE